MSYAMRHSNNKMFLAKVERELPRYSHHASRAGLGSKMHYRWTPNIDEALAYETDDDSWFDWFSMGEPPVDFVDLPERSK